MPQDDAEKIFDQLIPEARGPHHNFDAYRTAVKARLIEPLHEAAGVSSIREEIEACATPEEKDERLLEAISFGYTVGTHDEHRFSKGLIDSPELRVINYYEEETPEVEE